MNGSSFELPKEVFLSHSSLDRSFADALAATLRRHGVPVWYSTQIVGAAKFQDEIGRALQRCDWFAVILSPQSVDPVKCRWVRREVSYAIGEPRYDDRIIPILCEPCEVEKLNWVLKALQYVDFTKDPGDGYRELLRVWGLGYTPTNGGSL